MINTLAATVILTCIAAEAYCIQWFIDRWKRRREERREAQKAKWAAKYRKEIKRPENGQGKQTSIMAFIK